MQKKLIEVALPLEAINRESAREKSIRHGHPSTLHLWWARRPLAAARAVIWSSLVDDPSSHPEQFPTEEEQNAERERLFRILEKLVVWENSNNPDVLAEAKAEIIKSTNGNPPALLDPFAGGGAIPLEAQRLGLEAHAHDLNPVAVMINKAMIEIPPKFAGQPPVHPGATELEGGWIGAAGLAEDVHYYGEWMKQEAFKRIGHLYPKVKDEQGKERTVIAWIWARTVKCPNPACGCEMPLVKSFTLSKKKGKQAWIEPDFSNGHTIYTVHNDSKIVEKETIGRKGAICLCCGTPVEFPYIREESRLGRMAEKLIAIVAEGDNGRLYFSPIPEHEHLAQVAPPEDAPCGEMPTQALGFRVQAYGIDEYKKLFTNRQLNALSTFSKLVAEVQEKVMADGGSKEYGQAIRVYLAFAVDRAADAWSTLVGWRNSVEASRNTFARQALSMVWDHTEVNPFSSSCGNWIDACVGWIEKSLNYLPSNYVVSGIVQQFEAQSDCGIRDVVVSTDPPYYDNIGYADLSDFFYIWMRQSLKSVYPDVFRTMLAPKTEELIATPYRFAGNMDRAREFFESGMLETCKQIYKYANERFPITIYYAYKQSETDKEQISSSGWETMLSAMIRSGFCITGTWPISTEKVGRTREISSNALVSSIVLVCRKRPTDAPMCTRRDFINALKRELKPALDKLRASNIAPVDLAQSAIGPGMGVYSCYSKVLEADGTPMSVRAALQIINQELDLYFNEQDGEMDKESRFCVELYTQCAFNDIKFGEADVLARAKNTSVDKLRADGILYSEKGVVRLLTREELPEAVDKDKGIWLLTQQLTHAMETDGVEGAAKIVSGISTSEPERAKDLAYRLFNVAERKNWAGEAFAYNSLVIAWPDVQSRAVDLSAAWNNAVQDSLFYSGEVFSGEV